MYPAPRSWCRRRKVNVNPSHKLTLPGVTQHEHGRVVDDASKATFKVVGKKVRGQSGEVREGVLVPTKAMAEKVDEFTWSPAGHTGFFVRIKHVTRPQGTDQAFSMSGRAVPAAQQMSVASLTQLVDKHLEQFGKRPTVVILDSINDSRLPSSVDTTGVTVADGLTHEGVIYLFRDGLQDATHASVTFFHELLHYGLRRFLSEPQFIKAMRQLYSTDKTIRAEADKCVRSNDGRNLRKTPRLNSSWRAAWMRRWQS